MASRAERPSLLLTRSLERTQNCSCLSAQPMLWYEPHHHRRDAIAAPLLQSLDACAHASNVVNRSRSAYNLEIEIEECAMAVQCQDVLAGKCFVVAIDGDVRRVLRVRDGIVTYETRRWQRRARSWSTAVVEVLEEFSNQVTGEVGADYVPRRAAEFLYT